MLNILTIVGLIGTVIAAIIFWRMGIFQSRKAMEELVLRHNVLGPLAFILIQTIASIFPIIPGGLTTVAGVLIFGPLNGLIFNYIGIVLGHIALFYLGRTYGPTLIKVFIKEKTYNRYLAWIEKGQRTYNILFTLLILSPVAPDDALVLVSSQTKMSWKYFLLTILICKPLPIFLYPYSVIHGSEWLRHFFKH